MWRKSSEGNPEAAASNPPAPAPTKPQETPQAASKPAPATALAATSAGPAAPPAAAPVKGVATVPTPAPVASGSPSTISSGLKIKGEITGTSDLTIDGETQGKVRLASGRVTVGASGRVHADIEAREIVVNGSVQGSLKASEGVRLGPASRVEGSVLTPRIGIDDGARFRGNVEMIRAGGTPDSIPSEEQKVAQAKRAASASAED
jgi:cytoskeletal protein CcmA (bactofilin family)